MHRPYRSNGIPRLKDFLLDNGKKDLGLQVTESHTKEEAVSKQDDIGNVVASTYPKPDNSGTVVSDLIPWVHLQIQVPNSDIWFHKARLNNIKYTHAKAKQMDKIKCIEHEMKNQKKIAHKLITESTIKEKQDDFCSKMPPPLYH